MATNYLLCCFLYEIVRLQNSAKKKLITKPSNLKYIRTRWATSPLGNLGQSFEQTPQGNLPVYLSSRGFAWSFAIKIPHFHLQHTGAETQKPAHSQECYAEADQFFNKSGKFMILKYRGWLPAMIKWPLFYRWVFLECQSHAQLEIKLKYDYFQGECEFLLWDVFCSLRLPPLPMRPPSNCIHMNKVSLPALTAWSASIEIILHSPPLLKVAASALFQRLGDYK